MINASTVWYVYQVYTSATTCSGYSGYIKLAYCRLYVYAQYAQRNPVYYFGDECMQSSGACVTCMVFHCVFCGLVEKPHPLEEC